jgi:murein DD-endopeptidase MepM/ murein hydrolase activator NlpD
VLESGTSAPHRGAGRGFARLTRGLARITLMRSPRYTILIANRKTGAVRRLTVARRVAFVVAMALWTVPILVGLGAKWAGRGEVESLRLANDNLRIENESYRTATGELATQISSLQTAITQLGDQSNLDPAVRAAIDKLPAVIRSRAMGGALPSGTPIASAPSDSPSRTFGILHDLLDGLGAKIDTVRKGVETRQALAAATPSIWPLVSGWLTSSFGSRADPITGEPEAHSGLDISADRGTPVHATADGTVESAGYDGGYGNCILIDHGFGIGTRYGHLSGYAISVGQTVKRGQVIGYVGSTGHTTGPHLHYEILLNGEPVNPLRLLAR